ncbi:unnamed protein product [Urochloa humidicola]
MLGNGKDGSAAAAGEIEGNKVAATSLGDLACCATDPAVNKQAASASGIIEPAVVEVKIERVEEDYIQYLRTCPLRRPTPDKSILKMFPDDPELQECIRVTDANANKIVDMHEDILKQYDSKGYAFVGVEYLDDGMKRLFQIPEESTTA